MSHPSKRTRVTLSTRLFRALRNGNPPDHRRSDPATGDHQVQIHQSLEIRTVFETAALMAPDPHAAADQLLDVHVDAVHGNGRSDDGDPQAYALFH